MKKFTLAFLAFALSIGCIAQIQYNQLWMKTYGGSEDEVPLNMLEIPGNGYLIYGLSESENGDVSGNYGDYDAWVVKVDDEGNLEWEKNYGGSQRDQINSVKATPDGGYIMVGETHSNDHDVTVNYGYSDIWVVKINAAGDIEWQKSAGGPNYDYGYDVAIDDDGYVIAGSNTNYNLLKLSNSGAVMWTRSYGIPGMVTFYYSVVANGDGTFVLAGISAEVSSMKYCTLLKVTGDGEDVWCRNYTNYWIEEKTMLLRDAAGNYIVGATCSTYDYWLLKTNSAGTPIWEHVMSRNVSHAHGLAFADEGYLLSGFGYTQYDMGVVNMLVSPAGDSLVSFVSGGYNVSDRGMSVQAPQNTFISTCNMFLNWDVQSEYALVKTCEGDPCSITISDSSYCPPALLWATDGFSSYRWTRGYNNDTVFVGDTRVLEVSVGGHYNVTARNSYGCPSYATFDVPDPLFTPQRKDLCFVTVDETTGFNKIVFSDINPQSVVDSIYVYRTNEYNQDVIIGRMGIEENEFVDVNSNPAQQTYKYTVANLDTCGLVVGGGYHMTLLLQSNVGSNDEVNLMWNRYLGFDYDYAELYRSVKQGDVWGDYVKIAQLPVNSLSYTDLNPPAGSKKYQLRITPPEGCAGLSQVCSNTQFTDLCGTMSLQVLTEQPHCGNADGSATAVVAGGTPPYTYTWAGYMHGPVIDNIFAGNYHLLVVDAEGCTASMVATVENIVPELWNETIPDDIRTVECEGKIVVHVTGLLPPYTCSIDNIPVPTVNDTIYNVCAGDHLLTVNSGNCFVQNNTSVGTTSIPEGMAAGIYRLYPRPFTDELILDMNRQQSPGQSGASLTIYTLQGIQLITQPITNQRTRINTTTLRPGVYIVKVCLGGECYVTKVVK